MATVSVTCLCGRNFEMDAALAGTDRKSTRLNSSHSQISYAVFCLKKKKNQASPSSTSATYTTFHHHLPLHSRTDLMNESKTINMLWPYVTYSYRYESDFILGRYSL